MLTAQYSEEVKKIQKRVMVDQDGYFGQKTANGIKDYLQLNDIEATHLIAQCAHESNGFTVFEENLNYSAKRLLEVFPKHFSIIEYAERFERNPEKIANKVYANRMGNGSFESGDGWKYRGRGAIQLTGKNNYEDFSNYIKDSQVLTSPDLVFNDYLIDSAHYFFEVNNIYDLCEDLSVKTIKLITQKVNGGQNGLSDRIEWVEKISKWIE